MTAVPSLSTSTVVDAAAAAPSTNVSTDQPTIDTTPISPTKQDAATTSHLEHHLTHRPDAQDLKNRHILHYDPQSANNISPAIQQAAHDLERQRAADALKRGLERRPEKDALVERNILPEAASRGNVAPALLAQQKELERHMRKDSLDRHLQGRPAVGDLIEKGILNEDEAPKE